MRTLIIDDEPLARDGLRLMLAAHPDVEIVGEAGNGRDGLALCRALAPELVLVDVQMPERSGLELIAALPEAGRPAVVFVTAYDEFAVDAFRVHALDYLVKPIDEDLLAGALARARLHRQLARHGDRLRDAIAMLEARRQLAIRDGDRVHLVPIDDIDWIEAADYYVEVHAGPRTYLHREPLQRLAASLDPARFVRIHRSRLVNRTRIREIRWERPRGMVVVLPGDVVLAVARSCRAKLLG
jgi:two-component system, LytTR family, response regulator